MTLAALAKDQHPMCEECNEKMHRFSDTNSGRAGWSCDSCGWSWDDQPITVPIRKQKPKPAITLAALDKDQQVAAILTASPEALKAAWQRHQSAKANAARWGGPRAPRCNCGAMTASRAAKRGHRC